MACSTSDAARLVFLFRKHVGSGPVSAKRVSEVIKREVAAATSGRIKVSRALLTELRAERALAGRLAKSCKGTALEGYSKHNRRSRRVSRRSKRR